MRTRVLFAATAFAAMGLISGCNQTTPGTVAMTTEPGFTQRTTTTRPSTTTPRTTTPRSTTPRSTTPGSTPTGPRSDSLSMSCGEYVTLDPDEQTSVVEDIINQPDSVFPPDQQEIAKILVDGTCSFLPDAVVSELLLGTPP